MRERNKSVQATSEVLEAARELSRAQARLARDQLSYQSDEDHGRERRELLGEAVASAAEELLPKGLGKAAGLFLRCII